MDKTRSAFYRHLESRGSMTRTNPELVRLAKSTGYSVEHLFKVATGQRDVSRACAIAVAKASRSRDLTAESFHAQAA